ncbi:MAG TPA: hypothetical protein VNT03_16220 [Baekduia sp.]|nr:hypothetical protein [Baekduia sp.]
MTNAHSDSALSRRAAAASRIVVVDDDPANATVPVRLLEHVL